jgi:hypothetical protein
MKLKNQKLVVPVLQMLSAGVITKKEARRLLVKP